MQIRIGLRRFPRGMRSHLVSLHDLGREVGTYMEDGKSFSGVFAWLYVHLA